eukprot:654778-Prorocentrum_minimum.AAC.1
MACTSEGLRGVLHSITEASRPPRNPTAEEEGSKCRAIKLKLSSQASPPSRGAMRRLESYREGSMWIHETVPLTKVPSMYNFPAAKFPPAPLQT